MNIPAGVFKAKCLQLMDEVRAKHKEIVITKHGKPVAKLVPISQGWKPGKSALGYMKGSAVILGDIVGPIGEHWNADAT